jgi:hypothetical protein
VLVDLFGFLFVGWFGSCEYSVYLGATYAF